MSSVILPRLLPVLLDGRGSWELTDRQGRVLQRGQGHNLLLNQGLNRLPVSGLPLSDLLPGILAQFAVGDGAGGEPAATDTGLVHELARTSAVASASTLTKLSDGVYRFHCEKELDFGVGNGNLTEWGFSDILAPGANLTVREKFRDVDGTTPLTVTKTSDNKLRMRYDFDTHLGPLATTAGPPFTITGAASPLANTTGGVTTTPIQGKYTLAETIRHAGFGTEYGAQDYLTIGSLMQGNARIEIMTGRGAAPNPTYTTKTGSGGAYPITGVTPPPVLVADPYVAGSFQRTLSATWGTTSGNVTHYGWEIGPNSAVANLNSTLVYGFGYLYLIDPGYELTLKDNLKSLSITGFGVSFGRYP